MKERKFQKLTDLMTLLTFAVFALCVLLVLLSGARVYQRLTEAGQNQYDRRTATQYITTRIRQGEAPQVTDFAGQDALVFRETVNGQAYLTRVYCFDGWLRELFTPETGDFSPEDGEKLMKLEALSLTLENDLLHAAITLPDGTVQTLLLHLQTGEGGAP